MLQALGTWAKSAQWTANSRCAWRLVAWQLHLLLPAYGLCTLTQPLGEQQLIAEGTCVTKTSQ